MKYMQAVTAVFLTNGFVMLLMQYLPKSGVTDGYVVPCLALMCGTGMIFSFFVKGEKQPEGSASKLGSVGAGLVAGLFWAAGLTTQVLAVPLVPGYILFPVIAGANTLLVTVASRYVFKEHIGRRGVIGIGLCVLAIVLFSV